MNISLPLDLDVSTCSIGDDGAEAFARMLKSNSILQELHLRDNQIGDNGAKALARVLRYHNTSLLILDLQGNHITEGSIQSMMKTLKRNTTI